MDEHAVILEDVSRCFSTSSGPLVALNGVTLRIRRGSFLAITGPSGSGKTTLLNLMGALDLPSRGRVVIDGEPIAGLSSARLAGIRAKKLGFIFQNFNLIPVLSVRENVEYPLLIRDPRTARPEEVDAIIEKVGLARFSRFRPPQLSGGQLQRAAIARALVTRPALVLADEPTANLDGATGAEIVGLMRDLNRETGATFVFSTHDPRIIGLASEVVELRDGVLAPRDGVVAHRDGAVAP